MKSIEHGQCHVLSASEVHALCDRGRGFSGGNADGEPTGTVSSSGPRAVELASLANWLTRVLAQSPHFALVRGVPTDPTNSCPLALSCLLGDVAHPPGHNSSGAMATLRSIRPSTDRTELGQTLNELLHTDSTDWARPNDYTCLHCITPDSSGQGLSRLLDVHTLLRHLFTQDAALFQFLNGRLLPWYGGANGALHWAPVICDQPQSVRWMRFTIEQTECDAQGRLDGETRERLARFEQLVESCPGETRLALVAGDFLVVDNKRCLHARTSVSDPSKSPREMRRVKVNLRGAGT